MEDCIFCKIVKEEAPCHKIWEDEKHLAFLSIFPNTKGFSVMITKKHYPSDILALPEDALKEFIIAVQKVGKLLEEKLDDVGRTGVIFEGFGIDHAHAKFFPMHGTKGGWRPANLNNINKYFEKYEGYISSHDFPKRADDKDLAELAEKIREK